MLKKNLKMYVWLLATNLFISAFTFGGGYVIITLMKKKYVDELDWIKEKEMLDLIAIAQSAPGAIAINGAIVIGFKLAGIFGALISILATIIPPFVILSFVSTQGMQSAIATLITALYGFISGAYMPISSFSKGLANFLGLLPGTYGTSILRNHCMGGYLDAFADAGVPEEAIKAIRDGFDANIYVFDNSVSLGTMYGIFLGTSFALLLIFILIVVLKNKNISFNFIKKDKKKN